MANEQVINIEDFNELVEDHKKRFNGAYASLKFAFSGKDCVFFNTTLFAPEHWTNGISHNDPMRSHLMITKVGDDSYIAEMDGGSITINKRPEDKHMAYSSVKCRFRKTKGNAKKIIAAIIKWQEGRVALVKEIKDEIPNIEKSNLKDF